MNRTTTAAVPLPETSKEASPAWSTWLMAMAAPGIAVVFSAIISQHTPVLLQSARRASDRDFSPVLISL